MSKYVLKKISFFQKVGKITNFTFPTTTFEQIMVAEIWLIYILEKILGFKMKCRTPKSVSTSLSYLKNSFGNEKKWLNFSKNKRFFLQIVLLLKWSSNKYL